jgi:hypothetical protein
MGSITDLLRDLAALVGANWLIATAAAFIVMVCESAKPTPIEGEPEPHVSAFERVAIIASLAVPVLLFLHVFGAFVQAQQSAGEGSQSNGGVVLALIACAAVFVLAPGILGWIIAKIASPLANVLRRAAPWLALAVFVFTIYVTYRNAAFVLNLYVLSHLR